MDPDTYCVTGATGFLGRALVARLLERHPRLQIRAVARRESDLLALQRTHPTRIGIVAGDIADTAVAIRAVQGCTGVYHLAAFKHVPLAETNPFSCVRTNIDGTVQLLRALLHEQARFLLFISTDKAAQVRGVYGATKKIGEQLVQDFATWNPLTYAVTVRYGNVWGSTGSIGETWPKRLTVGQDIRVHDPRATRFFFTLDQALDLIDDTLALRAVPSGTVVIPQMKAARIGVAARACVAVYGGGIAPDPPQLLSAENLHETLDGTVFSNQVPEYSMEEFIATFLGGLTLHDLLRRRHDAR